MKSFRKLVLVIFSFAATIFLCGPATAIPLIWTDTITSNSSNSYIGWGASQTFIHDLKDNTPTPFDPWQDVITGYTLTLTLHDDKDLWFENWVPEFVIVDLPGWRSDGIYNFYAGSNEFGWSLEGLFSLNSDGLFSLTLRSILGDFYFDSSTLRATGYNNTAPVPEPASMILFGTGLVVFGFAGRKFKTR